MILATLAVSHGYGRHFVLLSVPDKEKSILYVTFGFCAGVMSFGLPKLAVVALLVRLLNVPKWHRFILWTLGALSQGVVVGTVIILVAQCSPARALWDFSITEKKCVDIYTVIHYGEFAGGEFLTRFYPRTNTDIDPAFSAFTDLYLAIFPASAIWALMKLSLKKRIGASAALGVGTLWVTGLELQNLH